MTTQFIPSRFPSRLKGVPLPRGIREDANTMSWSTFVDTYAPSAGPLRLGSWECADAERPATRLGPQARTYRATLGFGDRVETATATATGPVAALTEMLYEHGIPVEMLRFHQLRPDDNHVATFIQGSDGLRAEWAMGWSPDATQSALHAVIACANRLMT
ncbi:homocitrate synthase [Mycobacterium shimoidei]|uniref:2-isopropylmalate synthase [Clavibacter michiganensis subsp. sepedonicus] n=1 Tax=Mycobacterium shimoidei TaxID=29313 RepID=A0A1E3TIZ8_MYCSH|nr:homocitrate synthase [Mycobacterium shimoidei]MCV7257255.1 homocitrate synthase [Mycobacterium shimoidei]ODR14404.1 homocitrate synthase [Mycobacterium shimoidei]ORW80480.1 homocitrate synthase [Mycobacterium shimoidei]SRX96107.1 2-isopropylmalate synthase [Clavibacter michiganensis subsp. sepedonicus] [Mycobacterium shimoidei]